jgi:carbamoyltransferase
LGNAIYAWIAANKLNSNSLIEKFRFHNFTYLGSEYSYEQIQDAISNSDLYHTGEYVIASSLNIIDEAAAFIAKDKIVGWFQGKSEYGCRALGNRSILAKPDSIMMRDRVNILKKRELFRPLAPTVLYEYMGEYFDGSESYLSEFMLGTVNVKDDKKDKIAGVTHVDGTSRIQSLKKEQNPLFYSLIDSFRNLTGIPMVMNTSFNLAGEPIVESPTDAIKSFIAMKLDVLVIGNCLIVNKTSMEEQLK